MSLGISELLLILLIVFVLFGAGKLPQVMSDLGKSVKNFRKGMSEEEKKDKEEADKDQKK
jgi:sec-independent protein translocase protein TatA